MESAQPYIVSARKYRPSAFSTVVGQEALTATLKNAIDSGRLAQAYLFCGPRGVGKTSCARIFAKTINCLHPTADGEACGECESCRAIEQGNSFNVIELDAASNNSVDDIRNLTEQVNIPPQIGNYRVFIIDEVHMLSSQAFNAFLKTLEEPPKYVVFILATTEKHKVIPTILSRCQIYDFKRITIADISKHLAHVAQQEGIEAEPSALDVIARKADGAMRDALSIFDQVAASSMGKITYHSAIDSLNVLDYDYYFRLIDAFRNHNVPDALLIYKEIRDKGFDSLFFVNGLAEHIRDLMVSFTPQTVSLLEIGGDTAKQYLSQARSLPIEWYWDAIKILNSCDLNYRIATDKRLHVELCLIELCRLGMAKQQPTQQSNSNQPQQQNRQQIPQNTTTQVQNKPNATSVIQTPTTNPTPQQANPYTKPTILPRVNTQGATQHVHPARIRISGTPQPTSTAKPSEESTLKKDPDPEPATKYTNKPFSETDIQSAWEAFINNHSDRHLLVSAMRMARPRKINDTLYEVVADNAGIQRNFENDMPLLMEELRKYLENDNLTISIRIGATDNQSRVAKETPRQSLARMVKNNQVLYSLLDTLNMEMT